MRVTLEYIILIWIILSLSCNVPESVIGLQGALCSPSEMPTFIYNI